VFLIIYVFKIQIEGGALGFCVGTAMMAWYPDPVHYDIKNTVVARNIGLKTALRTMRGPILWSALVCGTFSGVECIMEQLRDETHASTWVNSTVAGGVAGMVLGSMSRRVDVMAASALGVGMLTGMVDFNGSRFATTPKRVTGLESAAIRKQEQMAVDALKEKYPEFKGL
jgi:hypothetical protein